MAFSRKSVVGATLGLILVGGIGGVGGYTGFEISERAYRHELAMSAAAGLPSQLETYRRTVDPSDNAADFYSEAASTWNRFKEVESSAAVSMLKGIGPDYSIDAAEKDLAKIGPIFAILDRAAEKSDFAVGETFVQSNHDLDPVLIDHFVQLRCLRAAVLGNQGDFPAAYAELARAAAISHHVWQENPTLGGMVSQIRVRGFIFRGLEGLLCDQGRSSSASANAEYVLKSLGDGPNMHQALRGEYAMLLGALQTLENPHLRTEPAKTSENISFDERDCKEPQARLLALPSVRYRMMASVVRFYRGAYSEIPTDAPSDTRLMEAAKTVDARVSASDFTFDFLNHTLTPPFAAIAEQAAKDLANMRLVRLLALNLSRPKGFAVPASFPNDPFTDKPFRSKSTPNGFRIWSVGTNGTDDAGMTVPHEAPQGDLVIGYPFITDQVRRNTGIPL